MLFNKFWFLDYEIDLTKIPCKGPAVLILYHGNSSADLGLIYTSVYLEKNRKINVVVDRFLFKVPGIFYY